ncbi:MAG: SMC family ATPase [Flavobacteriaceae bacterium]|nr:SMC family ATPase [Flavobacteriaceae bacterium]
MIPLKLTIEGLYSYQERQTIDFTQLTDAGLFGVFGAVGSGKSSILEAITFALFGETERMNNRDKRSYNMMNLKSSKSSIEFDFVNFENRTFRIIRDFRRNRNKFEDVKPQTSTFYENINGNFIPLDHTDAAKIINLSYTNFKRTIIIPQGQFKEFIELGATDRTRMMKEIYPELGKFDLYDKTSKLYNKNKSELDVLAGTLASFEGIDQENIKILEYDLVEEQKSLKTLEDILKPIAEQFNKLKTLKTDFEDLEKKKEEFNSKQDQKKEIDYLAKEVQEYERIYQLFFQKFVDRKRIGKDLKDLTEKHKVEVEKFQNLKAKLDSINKKSDELKDRFENLPAKRKEESDIQQIIAIKNLQEEEKSLNSKKEEILKKKPSLSVKKGELERAVKTLSDEIDVLNKKILDPELLQKVSDWYSDKEKFQGNLQKEKEAKESHTKEINRQNRELELLGIEPFVEEINFDGEKEKLQTRRTTLELKKSNLDLRKQLSKYAEHLHNGEACPLCGSEEHPKIIEIEDLTEESKSLDSEFNNLKNDEEKLAALEKKTVQIFRERKFFQEQLKIANEKYNSINTDLVNHNKTFIWKGFDATDKASFFTARDLSNKNQKEITDRREIIRKNEDEIKEIDIKLNAIKNEIQNIDVELARKNGQIVQNRQEIKLLNFDDFELIQNELLQESLNLLKSENDQLDKDWNELVTSKNDIQPKISASNAKKESLKADLEKSEGEIDSVQKSINQLISENQIENEDFIVAILTKNLNVFSINEKIQNFNLAYSVLKSSIESLEIKLKGLSFKEEDFSDTEAKFGMANQNVEDKKTAVIQKESELNRQKGELEKMKVHLEKKKALETRAENLSKMLNLFKGAGFVEYVSSIYLGNLCDNANERFHKMTRNQLSLRVNENNDFEIVDYLNDGRSRSVKTLSGGQSFQVSLSLALALAESVQSHAKADRNFFFIDEGFGTQDQESVNIVFETLMNLQKENRIVGIISHVEELKEKIPVSLSVTKDTERGSLIEMN